MKVIKVVKSSSRESCYIVVKSEVEFNCEEMFKNKDGYYFEIVEIEYKINDTNCDFIYKLKSIGHRKKLKNAKMLSLNLELINVTDEDEIKKINREKTWC
jgi:hypothetical protein